MANRTTALRPVVKLRSTAVTGYTHVTRKNRRNDRATVHAGEVPGIRKASR